jgi:hypothetical protein
VTRSNAMRETGRFMKHAKIAALARKRRRVNPLVLARWLTRLNRP